MDLTPQVLKDVEFREKFRGYDPDEVDAFLEQIGAAIGQLQSRLKVALDQAEGRPPTEPGRLHDPDGALQRVLAAAQETADRVVHEAEAEASSMVREAEEKSSSIVAEADEHSEKVRSAAEAQARKALEEARGQLLEEIADLRADKERLHGEVAALDHYLDAERADVVATIERLQAVLADPSALRLGEAPVTETREAPVSGEEGAASEEPPPEPQVGGPDLEAAPPAPETPPAEPAPPAPETAPPPAEPAPPVIAPAPQVLDTAAAPDLAPPEAPAVDWGAGSQEPDDPRPSSEASSDVVVDLTAEAHPAMAAATEATAEEAPPWAQGAEVIHGAFAPASEDAPLDLVDPDAGPPTEAYLNLFDDTGETGDRFLDELRRAVDDDGDALGKPDDEADAAMAAFFDQDKDDPRFGSSERPR